MVIAGCLNQAKRIISKFDKVIDGKTPEFLVEETHEKIRALLRSQELSQVLDEDDGESQAAAASCDDFIRKIVEAVAPILPITLRDKSLDSGYFRAAHQLLAASEFLFAHYEADVRVLANPAGVTGMCSSMHSEIKRTAVYPEELRSVDDFMKDMRAQYQTSLGLGRSYKKDSGARSKKQKKRGTGRSFFHRRRGGAVGYDRQQQALQTEPAYLLGGGQGFGPVSRQQNYRSAGRGLTGSTARGRGLCYGFQSGECRRGNTCRFLHQYS